MGLENKGPDRADRVTPGGIAFPGTSLENRTGSWRLMRPLFETVPSPCHAVCPAQENIPDYLSLMARDEPRRAWEVLVSDNPMPAVTGRVCPHPCETDCHRGRFDAPVSIHSVERFLGDAALREGWPYPAIPPLGEDKVAVVGAGPAGLSCAYHLRRQGIRVSLFDQFPEAGGTCRIIPDYRLPSLVLSGEAERILGLGITFYPGKKLGRDVSLEELEADYAAVFLSPGRQRSRAFSVAHSVPANLHHGIDLLWTWKNVGALPRWDRVVIVGGGNTAIDLARTLLRTGTGEVHVVTDEEIPVDRESQKGWPMPAIAREVGLAIGEGVRIHAGRTIGRILLREDRVVGVELVHALKELEAKTPVHRSFSGTETVLEADQVIPAVGQDLDSEGLERLLKSRDHLAVSNDGRVEGNERIFAGGDAVPGGGLVSAAIGSGHRIALKIGALLRGEGPSAVPALVPLPYSGLNLHYFDHGSSYEPMERAPGARNGFDEIETTGSSDLIRAEADRCLSCGHCLECDNCWVLCPDGAVLKTAGFGNLPVPYLFDYEYCKGCGLCARECPSGHIRMVPEE